MGSLSGYPPAFSNSLARDELDQSISLDLSDPDLHPHGSLIACVILVTVFGPAVSRRNRDSSASSKLFNRVYFCYLMINR
jgi:hypothetical protein